MKKQTAALAALGLCAAVGAAQLADLLLFTDPATGFAAAGPASLRYLTWLALGAACLLLGRMASPRPAALQGRCPRLGACMAGTALPLAAAALAALPSLPRGGWVALLDALTPLLAALWMLRFGLRLRAERPVASVPGVLHAVPGLLYWVWILLRRFELAPAAVERLPCTLRVLSASAAVLLAALLVKLFLVPGLPCGRSLFGWGMAAFGYGACLELPRALWEAACGTADLYTVLTACSLAGLGICGAVCAWYSLSPHLPAEEDEKDGKKPRKAKEA